MAEQTSSILVVDDDPLICTLFEEMLTEQGYEAVVAADAEEAIERLAAGSFDLVVTDKNLPGQSGLELLAHVKATTTHLEVIVMTAYADMSSALEAFSHGAYDYLIKPFDSLDEVDQKISRALEKRRMALANDSLIRDLTAANERIEAMNQRLEAQVEERTRQLVEANAKLQALTLTDDVTGLYNQRFLYQRLNEEFSRVRRYGEGLALMMLDLDNFKQVNDTHDHVFGSRVLRRVGHTLRDGVRSTDLVVRYGGDEFVVILPHTSLPEAIQVGERVRARIAEADYGDDDEPFHVTVSVGVASLVGDEPRDPIDLLRAADKGLYAAKAAGRNRVEAVQGEPE